VSLQRIKTFIFYIASSSVLFQEAFRYINIISVGMIKLLTRPAKSDWRLTGFRTCDTGFTILYGIMGRKLNGRFGTAKNRCEVHDCMADQCTRKILRLHKSFPENTELIPKLRIPAARIQMIILTD